MWPRRGRPSTTRPQPPSSVRLSKEPPRQRPGAREWRCQKPGPTHSRHSAHNPEHRSQEDKTLGSTPLAYRDTESQQGPDISLPTAPINPSPPPHTAWQLAGNAAQRVPLPRKGLAINTSIGELWDPRSLRQALLLLRLESKGILTGRRRKPGASSNPLRQSL